MRLWRIAVLLVSALALFVVGPAIQEPAAPNGCTIQRKIPIRAACTTRSLLTTPRNTKLRTGRISWRPDSHFFGVALSTHE